jgi:hypothetical protein
VTPDGLLEQALGPFGGGLFFGFSFGLLSGLVFLSIRTVFGWFTGRS